MLRALALAALGLGAAGTFMLVVIVLQRGARARREHRTSEERLTPIALAIAFEDDDIPELSKTDAIVLAELLGRYSARLRGDSRERIAQYFERHGYISEGIDDLSDRRSWRRATAAYVLGDMGSSAAIPWLVDALEDPERDVRAAAARSLGQLGSADAIEPLLDALSSRRVPRGVVGQAVLTLGPAVVPRLVSLLGHVDQEVRATAAELTGLLGGPGDAGAVLPRLRDLSANVRERASLALGRLGVDEAHESLEDALEDRAPAVRAAAAEALGMIGNARSYPLLLYVASTDSFEPARAAAHSLATLAPRRLQEDARLPDAGPFVREAASMASLEAGAR